MSFKKGYQFKKYLRQHCYVTCFEIALFFSPLKRPSNTPYEVAYILKHRAYTAEVYIVLKNSHSPSVGLQVIITLIYFCQKRQLGASEEFLVRFSWFIHCAQRMLLHALDLSATRWFAEFPWLDDSKFMVVSSLNTHTWEYHIWHSFNFN